MAAATHSPPQTSPALPLHGSPSDQSHSYGAASPTSWDSKPAPDPHLIQNVNNVSDNMSVLSILPGEAVPVSPRVQQHPACSSPVRVNFDNVPQPSKADLHHADQPYLGLAIPPLAHTAAPSLSFDDRDMPQIPDAPTPPLHSPTYQPHTMNGRGPSQPQQQKRHQPPPISVDESPQDSQFRPPPSPHAGLDFGFDGRDYSSSGNPPSSTKDAMTVADLDRRSRETDTTAGTGPRQTPQTSAATSNSSVSCANEALDSRSESAPSQLDDGTPEDSIIEDNTVPQLQYHHQSFLPPRVSSAHYDNRASASNPDLTSEGIEINRHLTPTSHNRRTSLPRPQSAYSLYSESGRGRSSPGSNHGRVPSSQSRKSPDPRMSSYAELLNVAYPQPAPAPITLDNSQLRSNVGARAALLSTQKTLEMYRQNVKKTTDFSIQYSFAVFLIATAQEQGLSHDTSSNRKNGAKPVRDIDSPYVENTGSSPQDLVKEAKAILLKLSNNGYPFAQYYLADGYASGLFNKGKEDQNAAFPLFMYAAKHGHAESAYRTALCYEFGWGCRKDPAKAVQFLRTAASKRHPGAMTRLGKACLSGDLGERNYRGGIRWLKLATEAADAIYNAAPYQLGCLFETGYGDDIFLDASYAAELFTQAAELGHPEANFRMGDAYEHGKLGCPRDPALSVHFYTGAAERGHSAAMMGLCAWYMVGADPILEKDDEEAYEWARRSAELGFVKAQYAVGYFTEMGIGCHRDMLEANVWYVKAADSGDERAKHRLAAIAAAVSGRGKPMEVGPARNGKLSRKDSPDGAKGDCIVM